VLHRNAALIIGLTVIVTSIADGAHAEPTLPTLGLGLKPSSLAKFIQVRVLEESTRASVARASVSLDTLGQWSGPTDGRAPRTFETNVLGRVLLQPIEAPAVNVLTIRKPGYLMITVVGKFLGEVTVYLRPSEATPEIEASGELTGWDRPPELDRVFGGIVFRPMQLTDLLRFELDNLISPLQDFIDVFGKRPIPSNIALPAQDVFLPAGGVRLNKPIYRTLAPADAGFRLVGAQLEGRVQGLISSVDILHGGVVSPTLVNQVEIKRMGLSRVLRAKGDLRENFEATTLLAPRYQITSSRPTFDSTILSVPVVDADGDWRFLFPTDAKALTPGRAVSLQTPANDEWKVRAVATIAISKDNRRFSAVIAMNPTRLLETGEYLTPDLVPDFSKVPESISMRSLPRGIAFAALSRSFRTPGRDVVLPNWWIFILPSAGEVRVPTGKLPAGTSIDRISLAKFEFSGDFDERRIDAETQLRLLARFAYATGRRTP